MKKISEKFSKNHGTFFRVPVSNIMRVKTLGRRWCNM